MENMDEVYCVVFDEFFVEVGFNWFDDDDCYCIVYQVFYSFFVWIGFFEMLSSLCNYYFVVLFFIFSY